jgi:hypothetical protein
MTAIYTTFTVLGFLAGSFLNYFGAKVTLGLGGLGYAVYSGAYLDVVSDWAGEGEIYWVVLVDI